VRNVLAAAGRSFLRAFAGSLLVLVPGVLAAPDLNTMYALGVAALISSVVAGIRAIQVFVPQLSFSSLVGDVYGRFVDSFVRAFLATALVLLPGVLEAPNLAESKGLLTALLVAAVTAGVKALEVMFTPGTDFSTPDPAPHPSGDVDASV
jgi:hypothetical protein